MAVSVFDLFKIGIGPSSSHAVGPMRAALLFVTALQDENQLASVARVRAELYGSLGATGKGHGSDRGVLLGLMGEAPDTVDVDIIRDKIAHVSSNGTLSLNGQHVVDFSMKRDIGFFRAALPEHPNGLKLIAFDQTGKELKSSTYLSVGGGFVVVNAD